MEQQRLENVGILTDIAKEEQDRQNFPELNP
jgi:hypothetical protein